MLKRIVMPLLVVVLLVAIGCEGKPPRPAEINWQAATVETLEGARAKFRPCMVVLTDGTEKCEQQVDTWLGRQPLEKAAENFVCMKVDYTKEDDPLVKEIKSWKIEVQKYPSIIFVHSSGKPGELAPGGLTVGELQTKMMQTQ